jgi:lysozyme
MNLTQRGLQFIKQYEGLRLTVYRDQGGYPTIGYGHKLQSGENWTQITEAEASALLQQDLITAERAVNQLVSVPLTSAMFDALVSLVFNWGQGNFAQSQLRQLLNQGDYSSAATRLGAHPVTTNGRYSAGLAKRRAAENALFLSEGIPANPIRLRLHQRPEHKQYQELRC